MKNDPLKEFIALRKSLLAEKASLEHRLRQINDALGSGQLGLENKSNSSSAKDGASGTRARNKISLREAVTRVTSSKPLSKQEILDGIARLGYRFTSKNPVNSLSTILYTKEFKNVGGRFTPASR
jgi:hypothetical protein